MESTDSLVLIIKQTPLRYKFHLLPEMIFIHRFQIHRTYINRTHTTNEKRCLNDESNLIRAINLYL